MVHRKGSGSEEEKVLFSAVSPSKGGACLNVKVGPMSPRTVYAALESTAQKYPNAPALQQPLGKGKYKCYTYKEYQQAVIEVATGLRSIGVAKGEIVALFSETRAEFYIADIGIMSSGAIPAASNTANPSSTRLPI